MVQASFATRRTNPRFSFFADAEMTLSDGKLVLGQLTELSALGCYVDTLAPIPIDTELTMRISDGMSSCEVHGTVIYMHSGSGLGIFGIGLAFSQITADQRATIDMWLRELAGKRVRRSS